MVGLPPGGRAACPGKKNSFRRRLARKEAPQPCSVVVNAPCLLLQLGLLFLRSKRCGLHGRGRGLSQNYGRGRGGMRALLLVDHTDPDRVMFVCALTTTEVLPITLAVRAPITVNGWLFEFWCL
jgi:hypothetical protein